MKDESKSVFCNQYTQWAGEVTFVPCWECLLQLVRSWAEADRSRERRVQTYHNNLGQDLSRKTVEKLIKWVLVVGHDHMRCGRALVTSIGSAGQQSQKNCNWTSTHTENLWLLSVAALFFTHALFRWPVRQQRLSVPTVEKNVSSVTHLQLSTLPFLYYEASTGVTGATQ